MESNINPIKILMAFTALMLVVASQFVVAGEAPDIDARSLELNEVNFSPNPSANARVRISKKRFPEDHPNSNFEYHTTWEITVTGLHCLGNHQQPDGHAEWTRQASYGLYINGLRMLTFNEGCVQNKAFGSFKTVIEVFVPLSFNPFTDDLIGEVVPENDDGWGTCDGIYPCDSALLRGEDIFTP